MVKKEVSKKQLLETAISAAKAAGKFLIKKQKTAKVKVRKNPWDFALDADIQAEKLIKKIIKNKFPDHSFLAEESKFEDHKGDYVWVIDPIDGTLNYANKIPLFSVSIAVLSKEELLAGVILAPMQKEIFYAVKGKGAFLNGKKIHVNKNKDKENILISGSPKNWFKTYKKVNLALTRYFRCSSLELAYVACGRFAARIKTSSLKDPFGSAAGALLIEEAGGVFTDLKGGGWKMNTNAYLASNKATHKKLFSIFKKSKNSCSYHIKTKYQE